MKIYYASRMGKVEALAKRVSSESVKIETGHEMANEPYILLTYTDGNGIVPAVVVEFLKNNSQNLKAVVASGSMARHADTYCFAGDIISKDYNVDCILKVDGSGSEEDFEKLKNYVLNN